jgi:polysaccharide biosynthesis transport protein
MDSQQQQQQTFDTPEIKLHFLDYWRIIRIRKTVILAVFLLVVITTTVVTFFLPESFSSTVRIAVEKDVTDVSGLDNRASAGGSYDPFWLTTQYERIRSKSVLHQVILDPELNLNQKWSEKYAPQGQLKTEETYQILRNRLDVRQSRNTSLIEISVYSEDKEEAAAIANKIAEVYRKTREDVRNSTRRRGIETLKKELETHEAGVKAAQERLALLRATNNIIDLGGGQAFFTPTLVEDSLRKLQNQRLDAHDEYIRWSALQERILDLAGNRAVLRAALVRAYPDSELMEISQMVSTAQRNLIALQLDMTDQHNEVIRAKTLLEKVEKQREDIIEGILIGIATRVAAAKERLDRIEAELDAGKNEHTSLAEKYNPYDEAKRALENLQRVRDALSLRIAQESIELALPVSLMVEVVDRAEPGLRAVRPNKVLNITLGVIVGLIVGIGLAFFIEYLDTSVKTIDDVERSLQAPVLGVIPQNVGSLLEEGPESPHAEAYRVLRTNILFSRKDDRLNTLTVISGGAGEGKSTTLFNLATTFAHNGHRVLIVDSDLRRPSIHKMLHISNSIGLTNYLLKQNTIEEVIQTTNLPTLDFMPSGKLPSSSMGILNSTQMKSLIQELKRRYDFVFFDSPPVLGVSDASILASEVDMCVQVIQYRRYPQQMTVRAKQMILKVGGNLLGLVLNNINMSQDENYYYYSGYYNDYYYSKREDEDAVPKPVEQDKNGAVKEQAKLDIKAKY